MSLLHAKLAEEIDHFTPVKTHTVNPKKARREPWLTTGIYISIRRSKKLYLETLRSNASEVSRTKYSNYAKQLQRVKRKAKLSYYEDTILRSCGVSSMRSANQKMTNPV